MSTFLIAYESLGEFQTITVTAHDYSEGDVFSDFFDEDGDLVFTIAAARVVYIRVTPDEAVVNPTDVVEPLPSDIGV